MPLLTQFSAYQFLWEIIIKTKAASDYRKKIFICSHPLWRRRSSVVIMLKIFTLSEKDNKAKLKENYDSRKLGAEWHQNEQR